MSSLKRISLLSAVIGLALALVACGGGGSATPTSAPKTTAAPAKPAESPAAAKPAASPAGSPAAAASPAAGAPAAAPAASGPVTVGGFPSQQLRLMAPAAPGGGWDQTSRAVQQALQDERIAAQPVEVINRPGAGGTVGLAEFINQNRGNGHTVMTMGFVMSGAILLNNSPVNLNPVTPLARLTTEYEGIAVSKDSKYQTLQQLLDDFKRDPKSISWGGGSAGGVDHILIGMIAQSVGVDAKDINYVAFSGGGELRPQVIGNQVSAGVSGYGELKADAESGQVRLLAVSGAARQPGSNAPTLQESGMNIELTNWRGIVGPPGMPDNQRQAWTDMLTRMRTSRTWQETLQKQDWTDAFLTGDQFGAFLKAEDERVAKVLKDVGLIQ